MKNNVTHRTESGAVTHGARRFNDVYGEKYLLLTTFTKDGRPKPTPVWGVPDGDKLLIITDDGSWKTKRINNTPRVTIQKCGALGKRRANRSRRWPGSAGCPRRGGCTTPSSSGTGGTPGGSSRTR